MLIKPYVHASDGSKKYLAQRELRKTSDGYGIVRYKKKLYFLSNDYEILLTKEAENQNDYHFLKDDFEEVKFVENRETDMQLTIIPPNAKDLFDLASMGIDAAVIFLRIQARDNQEIKSIYLKSLKLRSRYNNLENLTFSEANEIYFNALKVHPMIQYMKNKFFTQPFGSPHFISTINKSKDFTVEDCLTHNPKASSLNAALITPTAQNYLRKNILFHNSILFEPNDKPIEYDRLHYNNDKPSEKSSGQPFAVQSDELKKHTSKWRDNTKKELRRLGEEVVIRAQSDGQLKLIYDANAICKHALNYSAFTVVPFSADIKLKSRINLLHSLGVRKVYHLVNL